MPFWNCWRWRWVRWLNFCLLPWGVGLRRFSVFLVEARSSYRTSKRSTFTSTVRVSTVTWLLSRLTCTASAAAALVPVSRASSLKDTVFSSRFLWGWFWFLRLLFWPALFWPWAWFWGWGWGWGWRAPPLPPFLPAAALPPLAFALGWPFWPLPFLLPPALSLPPFWPLGAGAGLGSGLALFRKADRSASLLSRLRRSSRAFSSFSSRTELFFLSLTPMAVRVSRIFLTGRPVSLAKSVTLYFTIIQSFPPRV